MHIFKVQYIHDNDNMDTYTIITEKSLVFEHSNYLNDGILHEKMVKSQTQQQNNKGVKSSLTKFLYIYMYNYIYTGYRYYRKNAKYCFDCHGSDIQITFWVK